MSRNNMPTSSEQSPPGLRLLHTLGGRGKWISAMAWSPDGQTIASASRDGTIRFWEARSGNLLLRIKGHTASVNSVAWSPNGQILATEMTCSVCDATISLLDREERIAPSVAAKSSEVVAKMDQEADESRNHAPSHKWLG